MSQPHYAKHSDPLLQDGHIAYSMKHGAWIPYHALPQREKDNR